MSSIASVAQVFFYKEIIMEYMDTTAWKCKDIVWNWTLDTDDYRDNHAYVTAVILNRIQPFYDSK